MKNFDLEQNISGADAPGRGFSSAPQNISCNTSFNSKEVPNVKSEQNGRSMIEMLGVLAIIGVLSVGGIAGYSKAMNKYRVNKAIEQITLIAGNVRAFFAPQKNYIGVHCGTDYGCSATNGCRGYAGVNSNGNHTTAANGCPIIKKAKILPDEMITLDSTGKKITAITNPFGGWVELGQENKAIDKDFQAFAINYYLGDNIEACIELANHDWSSAGVKYLKIWSPFTDNSEDAHFRSFPIDLDLIIQRCSFKKEEGIENGIQFYFDVDPYSDYWENGAEWYMYRYLD